MADATSQPAEAPHFIDQPELASNYTNLVRVSGTPEEVVLDFGLNVQPFSAQPNAMKPTQRLVMSYYTAKRTVMAMMAAIQRHEEMFGAVEVDIAKRVKRTPPAST